MTTYSRIKEVKSKKRKELLKKPNVQGVGIGYKVKEGIVTKELSLRIYVEKKIAKESLKAFGFTEIIPDPEYKDVSYDIIEIGKIRFHGNLDKNRPTQGGDSAGSCHSISHGLIMTGTLGIPLVDKTDGTLVLLSNNHVFANKDHTNANLANVGDSIVQPGTLDGGSCHNDVIGTLKRWIEFDLNGDNEVDAAIAALNNESDAKRCTIGNDIGRVNGVRILTEEDDGLEVQKYGRTTGYTNGELIDTDVDVNVWYQIETDTGFDEVSITFVNQFLFTAMSQPGDSGSIILDMENKAVGLLFAGSNLTTIANPIAKVFELLELTLCPQIGIRCISVGPRPPLIPCKRVGPILHICKTIGGPIPIICPFGNPKFTIKPICLACGPDNDIGCGTGGSDFIIDVNKCKSGPFIDIRVIDPRIKDKDILVIDMSKIPKDMEKSIRNMLKKMNEEGEK